jgi:hypothetical protein
MIFNNNKNDDDDNDKNPIKEKLVFMIPFRTLLSSGLSIIN